MKEVPQLTKTKAQLQRLNYPYIGIQLKAGNKVFGRIEKFTNYTIYIKDKYGDIVDVPRRLIQRAMLLIKGDNDDGRASVSEKNKPSIGYSKKKD